MLLIVDDHRRQFLPHLQLRIVLTNPFRLHLQSAPKQVVLRPQHIPDLDRPPSIAPARPQWRPPRPTLWEYITE